MQLFDTCLLDILHRAVKDGVVKAALDNINAGPIYLDDRLDTDPGQIKIAGHIKPQV